MDGVIPLERGVRGMESAVMDTDIEPKEAEQKRCRKP
jgi:hypothetical protein